MAHESCKSQIAVLEMNGQCSTEMDQHAEYQLLLMKASDRGRNVKFLGNNFCCVWVIS